MSSSSVGTWIETDRSNLLRITAPPLPAAAVTAGGADRSGADDDDDVLMMPVLDDNWCWSSDPISLDERSVHAGWE